MCSFLKEHRRNALSRQPVPHSWAEFVARNVPYVETLREVEREELYGHIQVFLAEKRFEGCGGISITDEIRVTVAAQACILLLHRKTDYYPELASILIYPSTYVVSSTLRTPDGLVAEGSQPPLGESWVLGLGVLAVDTVHTGAGDHHSGTNAGLHEVADNPNLEA